MSVHMRMRHTDGGSGNSFVSREMTGEEMIRKICGNLPEWAIMLKGLRVREGLTQAELGEILDIEQTNISKMERGKRPIGKTIAKKLAEKFNTDYRFFL